MAGPHVSGVVALMISANPSLAGQVDTIEAILQRTAIPLITDQECDSISGNTIPNHTYGYGRIDALSAVKEAIAKSSSSVESNNEIARIFPNPVMNQLYIEIPQLSGPIDLKIIDARGQLVIQHRLNSSIRKMHAIDMDRLPSGIYYFSLTANVMVQTGKLVKL
jgi:hypothetical protein